MEIAIDVFAGALWDESEARWVREKGEYEVLVGLSSRDEECVLVGRWVVEREVVGL